MAAIASRAEHYALALRNNRMGLWLFFLSEAFLFGGLLATRFYLWGPTRPEANQFIGFLITVVLLISSVSMNISETAMEHGDRRTPVAGATPALGAALVALHPVHGRR